MATSKPLVIAGVVVSAVVLAGLGIVRQARSGARPVYRGHHLLVWAIDKKSGAVAGFSRATIRPGRAEEVAPVEGNRIRVEAGPVEAVTVTESGREWQEDMIRLKIAYGRSSAEGVKGLTAP